MITVGGFNTSIDKLVELDALSPGQVHRATKVSGYPGGKGLHVATAAAALGEPVALVGLIDRGHRAMFESWLAARGVTFHGVEMAPARTTDGLRTCVAVRESSGRVTEILEPGPAIDAACAEQMESTFRALARRSKVAVLSGSLPPGLDAQTYARLVSSLPETRCVIDASGAPLREAIAGRPFMVKPNREEAETWLATPLDDIEAVARAAGRMADAGIATVVISLGEEGALGCAQGEILHASVAISACKNPVGSGDALVGAMSVGFSRGLSFEAILRLGVACGAANAMTDETGFFHREDVERLVPLVEVRRLS